jgi:uncharacterized protein YecE (DUF72 family)
MVRPFKKVEKIHWHIGCSGFYYRHWRPEFYPENIPIRLWFEHYCRSFRTVELNTTFYNFPKEKILHGWYQRSPDDFIFTVKAPRLITHYKKFVDCNSILKEFYKIVSDGLEHKLGCILFQLPSNIVFSNEKLQQIIQSLDTSFLNVIEFRHHSWWTDDVYAMLTKNKISFSGISHPQLPDQIILNTRVLYYRFHGVPLLYTSPYTEQQLKKIAARIEGFKNISDAFIYFNNDSRGWAYRNAEQLINIVSP